MPQMPWQKSEKAHVYWKCQAPWYSYRFRRIQGPIVHVLPRMKCVVSRSHALRGSVHRIGPVLPVPELFEKIINLMKRGTKFARVCIGAILLVWILPRLALAEQAPGTVKWSAEIGESTEFIGLRSSPVLGADGMIYVGSEDGTLYAINPNGTLKWDFLTGDCVLSSPLLVPTFRPHEITIKTLRSGKLGRKAK